MKKIRATTAETHSSQICAVLVKSKTAFLFLKTKPLVGSILLAHSFKFSQIFLI